MPFQKGHKITNLDTTRYGMSTGDIADILNTTPSEVDYTIHKALRKLRKIPRFKYLEEYLHDYPNQQRISTIGDIEPSTLRNTEYDFSERSTGISPPVN